MDTLMTYFPSVASKRVDVTKKNVRLGENKTCFAAKLLKFGVTLDECSSAK